MEQAPVIGLRAKLTAAALAVVVGLGLCEVAARLMFPTPPEPMREPQFAYQRHPDLGFFHVPNQGGYLDDGFATTNALGLRGTLPATPRPAGSIRILAVGDSTTFGWGVDDDDTYPAQLEEDLRQACHSCRLEVVNGGVGAYNLKQTANLLEYFAPRLDPDIVLVGLYWNDLPYESETPEGRPLSSAATSNPAAGVGSAPFHIGNQPSRLNRILRRSRLLYVLRHSWLGAGATTEAADNQVRWEMALLDGRESPAIDEAWQDIEATLTEIRDFANERGLSVGVLIIPIRAQVEERHPHAAYQTRARAIAERLGLFAIDPLPRFLEQEHRSELFIPYDRMHLSARGNQLMAQVAFEALRGRISDVVAGLQPGGQ